MYTRLSYALRDTIPIMNLLKEMKSRHINNLSTHKAKISCRVFEDNCGAFHMAKIHKYQPRTKHLNVKLHHFRSYVEDGSITIEKIDTKDQLADYLTKPLPEDMLVKLRKIVMGW